MIGAEVIVSGKCTVCGKPLNCGRLFVCKECESKTVTDNVINDLEIAKYVLASPLSLDMPMRIKVGQAITKAIELLKKEASMKFIYEGKEVEIDGRCDDHKCMFNVGAFCQRSPGNEFKCKLEKGKVKQNASKNT